MYLLYNTLLLLATIILAPAWAPLLLVRTGYRTGFWQRCGALPGALRTACRRCRPIWVHAVSVGEVTAAAALITQLRTHWPGVPVVLSTATATGRQTARRINAADHVIFLPFDYPPIVAHAVRTIRPRMLITLETEIWPNLFRCLARSGIACALVSGRISERSLPGYRRFRPLFRRVLQHVTVLGMQTQRDAERIASIGADPARVSVTGNIKFDQAPPSATAAELAALRQRLGLSDTQPVLVAGSTHRGEEEILLDAFARLRRSHAGLTLILAPRHPQRFAEVAALLRQRQITYHAWSTGTAAPARDTPQLILLDTIGELGRVYNLATIVFVGGSLVPVGGHNVLEPASLAKPVLCGPCMHNFVHITRELRQRDALITVSDTEDLIRQAGRLLDDRVRRRQLGQRAAAVIAANRGALARTCALLAPLAQRWPT